MCGHTDDIKTRACRERLDRKRAFRLEQQRDVIRNLNGNTSAAAASQPAAEELNDEARLFLQQEALREFGHTGMPFKTGAPLPPPPPPWQSAKEAPPLVGMPLKAIRDQGDHATLQALYVDRLAKYNAKTLYEEVRDLMDELTFYHEDIELRVWRERMVRKRSSNLEQQRDDLKAGVIRLSEVINVEADITSVISLATFYIPTSVETKRHAPSSFITGLHNDQVGHPQGRHKKPHTGTQGSDERSKANALNVGKVEVRQEKADTRHLIDNINGQVDNIGSAQQRTEADLDGLIVIYQEDCGLKARSIIDSIRRVCRALHSWSDAICEESFWGRAVREDSRRH
ncbi:unnamed protein product [Vitrella brassicaformis CCMP3155]|uniref:Uncharacterized protein n=1 Tax=Vitrella brassicaformis (strain CCMP3155) TaxID=1169540 RepID=A0A0G4EGR0_VITBC|nr:unnamed protein product [Vitrella brassicaformis CCMP3155]|eukprot:CEL94658.1 unnamed protein product [Vitrella brassicaformis CCMP3155]